MEIPKPSEADKEWFRSIIEELPDATVKPMFGNLAAFVNGTMFCGLFGSDLGVRLGPERRDELLALAGAGPFGPPDRPMSEYVSVPPAWRTDGSQELYVWVRRAMEHTARLPPKKKKPRK